MVTLPNGAQVPQRVAEKLYPEYARQAGRKEIVGITEAGKDRRLDDAQAATAAENDKKLAQRKDEQAFKEKHAGMRLELTKSLQSARLKLALASKSNAETRLKIRQETADLMRKKFESAEEHRAKAEKLAQDAFDDMKQHRARGDELRAKIYEMKARDFLADAESMVGPMDELLSFAGIVTDDKKAALDAQARFGKTTSKAATPPAQGEMETREHNGVIYQRRKGSNDEWKRR
jgi:hypothetical protein